MPKMKQYGGYTDWKAAQSSKNKRLIGVLERVVEGAAPHLTRTVKWGQGCFADDGVHKIYIHAASDHVQLGFYVGATLEDPERLLEGSGKYVRHIEVRTAKDVATEAFAALIRQVTT